MQPSPELGVHFAALSLTKCPPVRVPVDRAASNDTCLERAVDQRSLRLHARVDCAGTVACK